QTAGHNQSLIFASLRQQHYEFVATVAECVIDQTQLGLNKVANFRQQLAADQMSVGVVDLLEVVKVDEHHRELISEASRAIHLGFERLIKMTRIVEAGAVIGDGEFLNFFYRVRILDGDGGIVAERSKEKRLLIAEMVKVNIDQLNDA